MRTRLPPGCNRDPTAILLFRARRIGNEHAEHRARLDHSQRDPSFVDRVIELPAVLAQLTLSRN